MRQREKLSQRKQNVVEAANFVHWMSHLQLQRPKVTENEKNNHYMQLFTMWSTKWNKTTCGK